MLFDLPDHAALYAALLARDARYDGQAYVCVASTGIFCRLTCPARKPKRENCVFRASVGECLQAGFRACKRCDPVGVRPAATTATHSSGQPERSPTQTRWAALTVDDSAQSTGSAAFEVESARVMATRAAVANAEVNIQNHGGIGFTWEHPAHRFVTRARLLELSGGSLADHQAALLAAPVSTS